MLIFILVLFILLFPTRDLSSTSPLVDRSLVPLKATSQLTSHLPIIFDGNADFASQAASEGWPGNGSKINPANFYSNDLSPEEYELMLELSSTSNQSFD